MATDKKAQKSPTKRVKAALQRLEEMKSKKSFWRIHWQVIAEYFLTRKASFTIQRVEGAFLNEELFDGTGPDALMKSASAIQSMLWPNGASSFQLERPRNMPDTGEVKKYYEAATHNLAEDMDEPRAGLAVALDEYHIDQVGFGTSGVSVMPGKKTVLSFKAENVKFMSIDEGVDGFVDTVYIENEWPLRRVVKEYGVDALHEDTKKLWNEGKEDTIIKILFCVQPRMDYDQSKEGMNAMEFESLHIEIDKSHLIKEGGFNDLPIKVARLRKALGEVYGRSLAMQALPDEQELNAVWESVTMCIEKQADPTLVVYDDGALGGNSIDTSAGAVNVFNVSAQAGAQSQKPVDILPAGEIKDASKLIEVLEKKIAGHFMLDRLLDFNNDVEMTLGEANLRNQIRGFLLGSLFARQTCELYDPMIHRAADICFVSGRLGVVEGSAEHDALIKKGMGPDEILLIPQAILSRMGYEKGKPLKRPPFRIKYISPAARLMQAEQAAGIVQTLDYATRAIAINAAAGDAVNFDAAIKILGFLYGAPTEVVHSEDEIKIVRQAREEAAQQAQQMQAAEPLAKAAKHVADAHAVMQGAGKNGGKNGSKATA